MDYLQLPAPMTPYLSMPLRRPALCNHKKCDVYIPRDASLVNEPGVTFCDTFAMKMYMTGDPLVISAYQEYISVPGAAPATKLRQVLLCRGHQDLTECVVRDFISRGPYEEVVTFLRGVDNDRLYQYIRGKVHGGRLISGEEAYFMAWYLVHVRGNKSLILEYLHYAYSLGHHGSRYAYFLVQCLTLDETSDDDCDALIDVALEMGNELVGQLPEPWGQ